LNNFWDIIGVTVVTFLIIGILFSFMFYTSEKKMKDARIAINKKVDEYMKTQ
jgi:amino acid permease